MKHTIALLFFISLAILCRAQAYYFPPVTGSQWDTVSPLSLDWCTEKLDTVYKYNEAKNTRAFIILHKGKIAVEWYFDGATRDSAWYWASAGKSLTAFLTGMAQEEGLLKIKDSTSQYLGTGWTDATPEQEGKITLWHQLTMTTGLDDGIAPTPQEPDPDNCLQPECLLYKADPGTRWAYHNAPYRLLQDVIEAASGVSYTNYTFSRLYSKTGITGLWYDYIFYSTPRSMARFGSLVINKGKWGSTTVLADTQYINNMVNTSQNLNKSYGYLWWLNGKPSYMAPGFQVVLNGPLVPNAPQDMVAALGKNDQKLYVIPGMDMVIVRMGNASGQPVATVSSYDNELWGLLNEVFCSQAPAAIMHAEKATIKVYPNPSSGEVYIDIPAAESFVEITDATGRKILAAPYIAGQPVNTREWATGIYHIHVQAGQQTYTARWVKQ